MSRRVLVTGCSSPRGIGFATARTLAERGHRVVATVRDHGHDEELTAGVADRLGVAFLDLLDHGSVVDALEQTRAALGGLDTLVSNAGFGLIGGIEQATLEQARAQFDTNYFGTLDLVRQVLPGMRAQGHGHLLALSSVFVPTVCPLAVGHYVASKAALESAFQALAAEVAPWGIRVTNVEPGPVDTDLSREWVRAADDPRPTLVDELYAWMGEQPGIEMETPEGVAGAIADLVESDAPPLTAPTSVAAEAWVAGHRAG